MKIPKSWNKPTFTTRVIAVILVVTLPFLGFYVGYKYAYSILPLFCEQFNASVGGQDKLGISEMKAPAIKYIEPTINPPPMTSLEDQEKVLAEIFSDQLLFEENSVPVFTKEYAIGEKELGLEKPTWVNVYQLSQGKDVIMDGYEGGEWEVDLDKQVNDLNSKTKKFMAGEKVEGNGQIIKAGERYWEIIVGYFKPAGVWFKTYTSYDSATKRLIVIRFTLSPEYSEGGARDIEDIYSANGDYCTTTYPPRITDFFNRFERVLAKY